MKRFIFGDEGRVMDEKELKGLFASGPVTIEIGEENAKEIANLFNAAGPWPILSKTHYAEPKIEYTFPWLRTADVLPPIGQPVLFARRKNFEEPLRVEQGFLMEDGRWKAIGHKFQPDKVVAWMPLPAPPEEE